MAYTMNREGIRRLAAEELGITTSPYRFASTREDFEKAIEGNRHTMCGKTHHELVGPRAESTVKSAADIDRAWHTSQEGGRAGAGRVIVEGFVDFDYEITQPNRAQLFWHCIL